MSFKKHLRGKKHKGNLDDPLEFSIANSTWSHGKFGFGFHQTANWHDPDANADLVRARKASKLWKHESGVSYADCLAEYKDHGEDEEYNPNDDDENSSSEEDCADDEYLDP